MGPWKGPPNSARAATRHVHDDLTNTGLRFDAGPDRAMRSADTAIPRRADQQIDACWALGRQHIVDVRFTISNADQACLGTTIAGVENGFQTVQPLLTFLLANWQLLAPSAFADVLWVTRPDLLGQQAQRDPLRGDGQRRMDEQALTGSMPQRPQALGGPQARPVGFGRILHGANTKGTRLRRL